MILFFDNETNKAVPPIVINKLTPIQMPYVDMNDLREGRKAFTKEEWIDVLLRSIGMEPDTLTEREKWLLLARMIPLVENNFNMCELGPGALRLSFTSTKRFLRTVFLCPVVKQRSLICSII